MPSPSDNQAPYVFISYANAEREKALHFADLLETHGIAAWIDRKSIGGGTSWSAEIVRGIEACTVLVVLCSKASMASPNVQQEIQLGWESRRPILPLLFEEAPAPEAIRYAFAGRQRVELLDRPDDVWLPLAIRALANLGIEPTPPGPVSRSSRLDPLPLTSAAVSGSPRHNLPAPSTSFIGREKEQVELARLLQSTRLLTLTGAGGCGKTRLALQLASAVLGDYSDGVWLVELAPLMDELIVPQAVLGALGLRPVPDQPITETLSDYLRERQVLLVMDNCEHLIGASARLIATLLRGCPKVKILATSRELLAVAGEVAWSVPSLALPNPGQEASVETIGDVESVRLFVDRATAVQPGFAVTTQNAASIAQICRRLDGIPLAIELAAARLRGLGVEQVAARLDDRFRLLTGGSRTSLRRQQTLRATVDWSLDLLSADERLVFRRLSVFAGGWTIEATEGVCADAALDSGDVLDLLLQLVDKSLVIVDEPTNATRYHFLEMIRQYAGEKLLDAGEAGATRNQHRDWYLALAERAEPELRGGEQRLWLDRLELELDNLRAALDWSHSQPDGAGLELRLAAALGRFWSWRGFMAEGLDRLRMALARTEGDTSPTRVVALSWGGRLEAAYGNGARATEYLNKGVALARQLDDSWLIAFALRHLAMFGDVPGRDERLALLRESQRYGRQAGVKHEVSWALLVESMLLGQVDERQLAERRAREALAISRESRDATCAAQSLNYLGMLADERGDYAAAAALHQEALAVAEELGYLVGTSDALQRLGQAHRALGDLTRAKSDFRRALLVARRAGDLHRTGLLLALHAGLAVAENGWRRAVQLVGAAAAMRREGLSLWAEAYRMLFDDILDRARPHLTAEDFDAAWAEGRAMTPEQAIALALEVSEG